MRDALTEIRPLFAKAHPEITVHYNFGGSGALQHQIENGAPVDLYIAAASKQVDALDAQGLLEAGARRTLLKNELVLVAAKDRDDIQRIEDLSNPDVKEIAIGNPATVPAGAYAVETLSALKLFESLKPKLIFTQDVRQALTYVASGNVQAGFVYSTDALMAPNLRIVAAAPGNTHSPIVYPAAVLKGAHAPAAAKALLDFLGGKEAAAVFDRFGFKR